MKYLYASLLLLFFTQSNAQDQTVGLFQNDSLSQNGYTLFAPTSNKATYLLDNCGNVVNQWFSDYPPGLSAYLLENGNLLRAGRVPSPFQAGGTGGIIELYDWNNNLLWSYVHSSTTFHHHHDMEYLPNGNILLIAWELHTELEAIQAGRNPALLDDAIWAEQIIEIQPTGSQGGEIVWEWHLWDHLIQDFNANQENYGVVADHPELVDINFGFGPDWIHLNSIAYNEELNQIVVSSRHLNEIWIIDHSTTTAEAAGHTGGNSGMGGDLLYRYGNPAVYDRGDEEDQVFYGQHDAYWIPEGYEDEGKIMVFNNGFARPNGPFSSVDIIDPPLNSNNTYDIDDNQPFLPETPEWIYTGQPDDAFYSNNVSGANRLPNGNTFICQGRQGRLFEITPDGEIVWEYINPVVAGGIVSQGQPVTNNSVFRAYRYTPDYPAFIDKTLFPGPPIESDPFPSDCVIYTDAVATNNILATHSIYLLNNPVRDILRLENPNGLYLKMTLHGIAGSTVWSGGSNSLLIEENIGALNKGIYFLSVQSVEGYLLNTFKVMILD